MQLSWAVIKNFVKHMDCKVCFYIKCDEQPTLAFGLITVFAHRAGWGSDNFKYIKGKFRPTFYEHYFIIIDKKIDSEEDYTQ